MILERSELDVLGNSFAISDDWMIWSDFVTVHFNTAYSVGVI